MTEDRVEKLELEVAELRKQLDAAVGGRRAAAEVSEEEMKTYLKVRDVVSADWGDFCGINDCFRCISVCRVCRVCAVCRVCIYECSCGPCNVGGFAGGQLSRFSELGE